MSRKTRLYDSGTLYHLILRGNGGQRTFSMTATLVVFISRGVHKLRERLKESTNLQERLKELNLKCFLKFANLQA